jgi:RNA polymerase sigma-32 factor
MALDGYTDQTMSRQAMKAELLDAETELRLAYAWRDQRDEQALHRLITAYMRLAISMASKFRRYGAPMNDLIQEASLGLMKAADKFDPDRGVRFSTYAVWWIKASIQDYVMRNWSMVRTGSTSSQKALFFNLRRVQAKLEREAAQRGEVLDQFQLRQMVATEVGVSLSRRSRRMKTGANGLTRWKTTASRPPRRWKGRMTPNICGHGWCGRCRR